MTISPSRFYSQVYDECFTAFNRAFIASGHNALGGPIEQAFHDMDAVLGPKQGLRIDADTMELLATDMARCMKESPSGYELYKHVIECFAQEATCHGIKLKFAGTRKVLRELHHNAIAQTALVDGGSVLHADQLREFSKTLYTKPPSTHAAQSTPAADTPSPGKPPEPLLEAVEKEAGTVLEKASPTNGRKAIQFFTHDAKGMFSSKRTTISAVIVAAIALTTGLAMRAYNQNKQEEISR